MRQQLQKVLFDETANLRALCRKFENLKAPIEPHQVKLFLDFLLNISAKTRVLEQFAYGKLKMGTEDSMFTGLSQETKDLLAHHFEEMTQVKVPTPEYGKRTRTTHYELLANMYEEIFGIRADHIIMEDQNKDNPYLLELLIVDALYKASKQKITMTVSLLQVIQYMEPFIMAAMKNITRYLVNTKGEVIFTTEPQYITEHENKDYYKNPILLMYYADEAPKMINGYIARFAHVFNDAFGRIDELMFSVSNSILAEPGLSEN